MLRKGLRLSHLPGWHVKKVPGLKLLTTVAMVAAKYHDLIPGDLKDTWAPSSRKRRQIKLLPASVFVMCVKALNSARDAPVQFLFDNCLSMVLLTLDLKQTTLDCQAAKDVNEASFIPTGRVKSTTSAQGGKLSPPI